MARLQAGTPYWDTGQNRTLIATGGENVASDRIQADRNSPPSGSGPREQFFSAQQAEAITPEAIDNIFGQFAGKFRSFQGPLVPDISNFPALQGALSQVSQFIQSDPLRNLIEPTGEFNSERFFQSIQPAFDDLRGRLGDVASEANRLGGVGGVGARLQSDITEDFSRNTTAAIAQQATAFEMHQQNLQLQAAGQFSTMLSNAAETLKFPLLLADLGIQRAVQQNSERNQFFGQQITTALSYIGLVSETLGQQAGRAQNQQQFDIQQQGQGGSFLGNVVPALATVAGGIAGGPIGAGIGTAIANSVAGGGGGNIPGATLRNEFAPQGGGSSIRRT